MALPFDPISEARRNWLAHGWKEGDAMAAATSVVRAQQILLGRIEDALAPLGLTFSRFEALALLHFTQRGSLPMGKIGARLQVHPTSVTNAIARLERSGLVVRRMDPSDRRAVLAEITPAGRELVQEAAAVLASVRFGLPELSDGELAQIEEGIRVLRKRSGDFDGTD